ncbi:fasciclin-2-like isoform X1 [Diorhabda carinulata]|uniref:fasciclin-2-like isoform X1 n=1 Tax=Diorhabda carinulata TaxID=1163345 RepID=UPI0025A0959A|nr:fasciclin-2-like isoform X1 [Diorhabda carinulata]
MLKDEAMLTILLIFCLDLASSLYLSHSRVNIEPGKSLAISCRDRGGEPVMWKGPKGTLSANTKPKIQDTSIGKLLVFTSLRIQDTGNYTCSLINNNRNDYSIFSLTVEESHKKQDSSETSDIESYLNINLESDTEPETPSPTIHRRIHKQHKTKYRNYETTTQDTHTTDNSETSTIEHSHTPSHSGRTPTYDVTEEPIEFKDTPEIQRGREGENVTLRCEVNRPYKISWLLDKTKDNLGSKYIVIGDGLLIVNVSRQDNRVFICEAHKYSIGQVIYKKIKFIVEHKPVPVTIPRDPESTADTPVYAQDEEVYGFIGEYVNLTCEVEAEPPPKFEWKGMSTKQGRNYIGRIINVGTHKSLLQLKMTSETPDRYECTATNKYGKLKKFINLQIGIRPNPPESIELIKAEPHSLELKVEIPEATEEQIGYNMEPKWLSIFYRMETGEDWDEQDFNITLDTFLLTELNSSTKYEIVSATKNVAGLSSLSNATFFETTAGCVQISKPTFFSLVMINTLILFTSILA